MTALDSIFNELSIGDSIATIEPRDSSTNSFPEPQTWIVRSIINEMVFADDDSGTFTIAFISKPRNTSQPRRIIWTRDDGDGSAGESTMAYIFRIGS